MCPGRQQRGRQRGAVIVLRHETYNNYVSSVDAGIGLVRQIMCVEQCTFLISSVAFPGPQNAPNTDYYTLSCQNSHIIHLTSLSSKFAVYADKVSRCKVEIGLSRPT